MRSLIVALSVSIAGCSAVKQDTELTLRRPPQNLSIELIGSVFLGSATWGMDAPKDAAGSDWLRVGGTLAEPTSSTSVAREVSLDVPLNMLGEWNGPELVVSYSLMRYSDADSLGVARLYHASEKSWHHATVEGEGEAPRQDNVDDAEVPPSAPNGEFPADYIDGYDRFVVRAVDLKFNSSNYRIGGQIVLQSDNGVLPEEFDAALDVVMRIEGTLNGYECRSTSLHLTSETGVAVLRPEDSFDAACLTRFNL